MSILEAVHLTYTYPRATQPVLNDLCFEVEAGEVISLVGSSGSGKSTLLLALAGIVPEFFGGEWSGSLRVGEVWVDAEDSRSADVIQQVAIAFQVPETQLIGFRVEETIAFGLENQGVPAAQIRERIGEVLAVLGIEHLRHRMTDQLSGGQKQAVVLAAMLALDTPIMVLDEPTTALDPAGKQLIGQVVERLKSLGKTLIISDHNLDWFQQWVDRVLVLSPNGSLLCFESLRTFLADTERMQQSGITVPSLAAATHRLNQQGIAVAPWLSLTEARNWLLRNVQPAEDRRLIEQTTSTQPVTVDCQNLTFTYPHTQFPAIRDVSFQAQAGKILGVIGQNGSGKSTAIRHLNGLLHPQSGTVWVNGQDVARQTVAQMAHRVGIAFQNPDLMLFNETVEQEVFFSLNFAPDPAWQQQRRIQLEALMAEFDLACHRLRSPLALSVGEKQMLAILCALALDPAVLVLDEPTFGLDQRGRMRLGAMLSRLRQDHKTIICISHDLSLLCEYADEIAVFNQGQIECCLPTPVLLSDQELFQRIHIPLPDHVQLANEFFHTPCLTPTDFAALIQTHVSPSQLRSA